MCAIAPCREALPPVIETMSVACARALPDRDAICSHRGTCTYKVCKIDAERDIFVRVCESSVMLLYPYACDRTAVDWCRCARCATDIRHGAVVP